MAPVRPHHAIRQQRAADDRSKTDYRNTKTLPRSPDDAHMAMPHHGLRRTTHTLPGRHTLEDTLAGMRGFLEHRIEVTATGHLNPY